ncbi:NADP-dependent oxidoreductase [uncultured Vagococcus sp.]|uniref:quinone oxidoreductase family protein n=1 Tax=uncultured Vagococcus sp. TaxID=189676 RepID=UPI0028D4057F|nr:NADP-dependent oxidoreductase [uncultured Vagococcus sp.]
MNAFGFNSYGPPTVLEILRVPQPELKANQVLLKNLGFGLNPYDAALRAGDHLADRTLNFPFIPGSDAVGQVIQIGSEVDNQLLNQVVIAHPFSGGYGEELVISAKKIISKPVSMSLAEAAGFSTVATIAYHALITTAQIKKGETLIIQGASGSVGSLAAQIAKANGLYVIGVGNSRNRQMMRELGIDEVVAYDQEDVAQVLAKRGDVVLDASLQGRASHVGLRVLNDGGRYLFLNQAPDLANAVTLLPIVYGKDLPALSYLCNLYSNGQLKLPETISHKATLENLIAGHQALLTKKERGKLVFLYE